MSFITNYLDAVKNTKPATEYHIWSMLSVLSVFAGRRFWLPFGPYNYYTNLYVVLVGDPGTGKSAAMDRAKEIVRASGVSPIAATQITKEAMSLKMSNDKFAGRKHFDFNNRNVEYNQYAIFATELVEFLGVNPLGFLDCLTSLWTESVWEVETKNKGNDYVQGPYVTLLGCMTPEKLKGYMKMDILTGGFARRCAFMFCATKNLVPKPTLTAAQTRAENYCVEFGKNLQTRSGPFALSEECDKFYVDWFYENERVLNDRPPKTKSWFESKGEMLFKLSMLIALAELPSDAPLVIDVEHYKLALKFCGMLEKTLERVFEGTGINPNAGVISQVVRMLEALGKPMNKKHLLQMFIDQATGFNELNDVLSHLILVGRLVERMVNNNGIFVGTLIGTPKSFEGLSDSDLVRYLVRPTGTETPQETVEDVVASFQPSDAIPIDLSKDSAPVMRQVEQHVPKPQPKRAIPDHLNPVMFSVSFQDEALRTRLASAPDPEDQSPD